MQQKPAVNRDIQLKEKYKSNKHKKVTEHDIREPRVALSPRRTKRKSGVGIESIALGGQRMIKKKQHKRRGKHDKTKAKIEEK